MDNNAKIYILYFVLEDTVTSICNFGDNREASGEKLDRDRLFQRFLTGGKNQYGDLQYDLAAEIGLANYKAEQEFGRLATKITNHLGKFTEIKNSSLVYTLWIALELASSYYFSVCADPQNLVYNLEDRLRLAQEKYLSLSQSNSEEWQNIESVVKSNLGNF